MFKIDHNAKGLLYEKVAEIYLLCKGYQILARRWRLYKCEIDIIAKKGNSIIIVEVKYRKTLKEVKEALNHKKINKMIMAGRYWLTKYKNHSIRFDYICCLPWKMPLHYKGAFESA